MKFDNYDPYNETRRDVNFGIKQYVKIVVVVVLVLGALSLVGWGVKVAVSEPKGRGDAYAQKNSAENWTRAQAEFNDRYQNIKALDKNITVAANALKRDPDNTKRQVEYDGLVRNCNDAVGEYNSEARKYMSSDFRDADLPAQIDETDPSTNCQEN